jgi:RimJ/RimL family protein N-acetyltransferase
MTDGIVLLRLMTPADAAEHLAGEDELAARFLSGGRSTIETVLASIERNRLSWDSAGPVRCLGICLAATGVLIGMVEANLAAPGFRPRVANISYGLYPEARGQGYATRAVALMLRYLTEDSDADVAAIQVHPENHASARVPVRAGFHFLGERMTPEGDRMMTYARALRSSEGELRLSDVCELSPG